MLSYIFSPALCLVKMTEEIQLVEQLVRGSGSAFKKIYDIYSPLIYNNIRKIVHPISEAEDLLQEVFTCLWQQRETIDPEQPISNWLFVVSYNKSVSYLKRKLRQRIDYTPQIDEALFIEEEPLDEELYIEKEIFLQKAIERLPAHKRKVIQLYYFEHKDCDTIAIELNLTVSSVRFYLKQAKGILRDAVYSNRMFSGTGIGVGISILFLLLNC